MARKTQPAPTHTIETFRDLRGAFLESIQRNNPSCSNGEVDVVKFRVTVEAVEEPVEVIHARLEKLWRESANIHHTQPLRIAAKKYGYTFTGERGCERTRP